MGDTKKFIDEVEAMLYTISSLPWRASDIATSHFEVTGQGSIENYWIANCFNQPETEFIANSPTYLKNAIELLKKEMTNKEKILALEIENARLREVMDVNHVCDTNCAPCPINEALAAQPPNEVISKLKDVRTAIEDVGGRIYDYELYKALVVLKELGVE